VSSREVVTHSSEETIRRGRELGLELVRPVLVLLSGDLGAGKTTLTKGIVSGLGAAEEEEVTSPTFTLVHRYGRDARVYHVDLYRIEGARDLDTLGLEDLFAEPAVVIVEWAEKLTLRTDWPIVRVHLEHAGEDMRRISVTDTNNVLRSPLN
jgi:tRNA threonylcarbamoyladenosine biosynthesis protein TsaE